MSDFNVSLTGGQAKRLLTGGKYCPADIVVTAERDFTPPTGEMLDPDEVYRTTRPADWLPLPTPGDNEMYLLGRFLPGLDEVFTATIKYNTSCLVEFGTVRNGVFVAQESVTPASNTYLTHTLLKENYGDETADGWKQYMVRISGDFTTAYFTVVNNQDLKANLIDAVCGRYCDNIRFGDGDYTARASSLRYFRFVGNGGVTNAGSMFARCTALKSVSSERKQSLTNAGHMFNACRALLAVSPNLLQTNSEISAFRMFYDIGAFNVRPPCKISIVSMYSFFQNSRVEIVDGNAVDTSYTEAFNEMTNGCVDSLRRVIDLNISSATNVTNIFNGCRALQQVTFAGETTPGGWTINLSSASLSHTALVEMIASLPTATAAATITISGNPGASELTDAEIAVATAKNWTITR